MLFVECSSGASAVALLRLILIGFKGREREADRDRLTLIQGEALRQKDRERQTDKYVDSPKAFFRASPLQSIIV